MSLGSDRLAKLKKNHQKLFRQTASELLDIRGGLHDLRTSQQKLQAVARVARLFTHGKPASDFD